jgi:hypothetical protein
MCNGLEIGVCKGPKKGLQKGLGPGWPIEAWGARGLCVLCGASAGRPRKALGLSHTARSEDILSNHINSQRHYAPSCCRSMFPSSPQSPSGTPNKKFTSSQQHSAVFARVRTRARAHHVLINGLHRDKHKIIFQKFPEKTAANFLHTFEFL